MAALDSFAGLGSRDLDAEPDFASLLQGFYPDLASGFLEPQKPAQPHPVVEPTSFPLQPNFQPLHSAPAPPFVQTPPATMYINSNVYTSDSSMGLPPGDATLPWDGIPHDMPSEGSREDVKTAQLLKRQAAVQAKNRKAQKKFREKQKAKMANLEQEVQELKSQLGQMKVQYDSLSSQNGLLTNVLDFKDRQMVHLQNEAKVLSDKEGATEIAEKAAIQVSDCKQHTSQGVFPVSKLKDLNEDELKKLWKTYVQGLSQMMVSASQNPNNKALDDHVDSVLKEIGELLCKASSLCPSSMKKLVSGCCEGDVPEDEEKMDKLWKGLMLSLDLTEAQELLIMSIRETFISKMNDIWEERTNLNHKFQECSGKCGVLNSTAVTCKKSIELTNIMERLRDTIHREHICLADFIGGFFRNILRKDQRSRIYVQSYPFYPDVLYISNLVAQKRETK